MAELLDLPTAGNLASFKRRNPKSLPPISTPEDMEFTSGIFAGLVITAGAGKIY
jgi:hypothetical protein